MIFCLNWLSGVKGKARPPSMEWARIVVLGLVSFFLFYQHIFYDFVFFTSILIDLLYRRALNYRYLSNAYKFYVGKQIWIMIAVKKDFKSIKFKLPVWNSIHPVYKFLNIVVLHVAPDLPEIRVITILEVICHVGTLNGTIPEAFWRTLNLSNKKNTSVGWVWSSGWT